MSLRFSRSGRRSGAAIACVVSAVLALGACSGGSNGAGYAAGKDSGVSGEAGGGADSSTAYDSGSSSGGQDATTGGDSGSAADTGGAGDDGAVDAAFTFDGFAHADGYSEASYCPDDDGDGWTVCAGDCNDHDSLVNPCAFDTNDPTDPVGTDGVDNDCDGKIDNLITCETGLVAGHDQVPADYAHAADLCDNPMCPRLTTSLWYGTNLANAKRVTGHMGAPPQFSPHQGSFMAFLSNGTADDNTDTPAYLTCPGTILDANPYPAGNPMPLTAAQNVNLCGQGNDESTVPVYDYTELRMTVTAPINAGSYTFDFAFFSEEYPVYVCQGYNDTFLAIQTSKQFPAGQQIAYDANGHRVNVNNAFFEDCNSCTNCVTGINFTHTCANPISTLNGTGYEKLIASSTNPPSQCNEKKGSGGTDWLKTTSPVQPGETFTLSWVIFDENDGILDSSVILDHFRWHSTTLGNPVTGR
jgi:hypothetical protein